MIGFLITRAVDRAVETGVRTAVDNFISSGRLEAVVDEALRQPKYRWFWFVKAMQSRMMEVDKTLTGKRAYEIALNAYTDFLHDEKVKFGDPRFDWSREAARALIQDMEIDHWESAP